MNAGIATSAQIFSMVKFGETNSYGAIESKGCVGNTNTPGCQKY